MNFLKAFLIFCIFFISDSHLFAQNFPFSEYLNTGGSNQPELISSGLKVLFILSILSLAPSLIMMLTSFVRIVIVFSFVKMALSLQQIPPTSVLVSLSLFLTFFIMMPSAQKIYQEAYIPFEKKEINLEQFYNRGMEPIRSFMFKQIGKKDREIFIPFIRMAKLAWPKSEKDIPNYVLIPSFILSELKKAFYIGIIIYIPFIIIDLLIASILMSMGMIMLPPVMISLPFKLILFVLIGGWDLIANQLILSF